MGILSTLLKPRIFFGGFVNSYGSISGFERSAYEHEIVRGIIDVIALHSAKAEAMHVIVDDAGRVKKIIRNSPYSRLLNLRANDIMTGYDLKYRIFSQREQYTTAFCYIKWEGMTPVALIPVDYSGVEIRRVTGGRYACQFSLRDGGLTTLPMEDLIVLRKLYGNGEVLGDGNDPIKNTLTSLKAADEGNREALQVANKVRGILQQKKAMLSEADVRKASEEFNARFAAAAKNGGIVGVDSMESFQPLKADPLMANAPYIRETKSNISAYWHVAEPIVTGDYSEGQFQGFFETAIEPGLINASQAFTNGFFTPREIAVGNRLIFNTSSSIHASLQTKIQMISQARETGLLTINEQRELLGYPPVEGGDDRQISLNYINAKDQAKYQTGKDHEDKEREEEDDGANESD